MHFIFWIIFWISLGLIVYADIVYCGAMWAFGRWLKGRRPAVQGPLPRVSMIIPAHNEETVLAAKLENALSLDYPRDALEIIVASDGSTDRTVEIARHFQDRGVRLLELEPNRGKSTALNAAVEVSTGDVLCLCDANVLFRPDALKALVTHYEDPEIGAVSGDVQLASEESDFEIGEGAYYRLERAVQLGESRIGSMLGVDGGMYVIRRELFQTLPPDTILDDFVTSMHVLRQGRRILYEPSAIATENGTPSWKQEFRRRMRLTIGAVQSVKRRQWPPLWRPVEVWQYLSHKFLRWLGPIWLMLLFVSSALMISQGPVYRAIFGLQVGFYGLALAAAWSDRFRASRLGGIPFYFTMSHIAMLFGLFRGLGARPTGVWEHTERTSPATPRPQSAIAASREKAPLSGRAALGVSAPTRTDV
jgi:cellulose synthase/poly-beta-1,6-N-acetylglucosamine synthase-like glycosyltransferase